MRPVVGVALVTVVCLATAMVVPTRGQTTSRANATASSSATLPAVAKLPPLALNLKEASLAQAVAELNRALGTDKKIAPSSPDDPQVRFTLAGTKTFGEAICALSAQHGLVLSYDANEKKALVLKIGVGNSSLVSESDGVAVAALGVHVRQGMMPSGPAGATMTQPNLEFEAFFDPRLPVTGFGPTRWDALVDASGQDSASQFRHPPEWYEKYSAVPPGHPNSTISTGWSRELVELGSVAWSVPLRLKDADAADGSVKLYIHFAATHITLPPRGTPAETRSSSRPG